VTRGLDVGSEQARLLERELELTTLDTLLERVRAGRGGRLLIEGPAGIGKSTLLEAAIERAQERGMRCLSAEAAEVSSQVAFGVARAALGSLWPAEDDGTAAPAALARGVRAVLDLTEQAPLAVCVDDLQWADGASLRWLSLLAQRASETRLAVVLVARTDEVPEAHPALSDLLDDRRALVIRPAPLSIAAAAQLVCSVVGHDLDEELIRACHAQTRGNPYLLSAVADAIRQDGLLPTGSDASQLRAVGSRAIGRAVNRRLERLAPEPRALIEALATVGDIGGLGELAALLGVEREAASDAAETLVRAGLLRSLDPIELTHPLVGAAIRAQLSAGARQDLANAAASRLAAAGRVEEAAARLLDVPPAGDQVVAQTLLAAGERAFARGAPDVTATLLRRAADEPPRDELEGHVWSVLGRAQLSLGDPAAVGALERALERSQGAATAGLAQDLALALTYAQRTTEAVAVLDQVRAGLSSEHADLDEELDAIACHHLSFDSAHHAERRKRLRRWGERRGASEAAYRLRLGELAIDSLLEPRPAAETASLAERALASGTLLSRHRAQHSRIVLALAYAGQPAAARVHLQDAIALGRERGDSPMVAVSIVLVGETRRLEGDMVAVESDTRTGLEVLEHGELGPRFMLRGLIESLVEQGRVAEAEEELRNGKLTGELPAVLPTPGLLCARAQVRIAAGSVALGLDDLLHAGKMAEELGLRDPHSVPWRLLAAEALARMDERERAQRLIDEHLELARVTGLPEAIAPGLRMLGAVTGDATVLAEAVELLEGSFAQLELARALIELGSNMRSDDRSTARELLERGAGLAERLGAATLAARAASEAITAGGRPRRTTRRGVQGLTASERRTARLAAAGMTNREIAETLVLSEKTIETHLAASFRKLGIRSRVQLPDALAGAAPAD
jgi:DNA-binding CsgD family transcriptional regulator